MFREEFFEVQNNLEENQTSPKSNIINICKTSLKIKSKKNSDDLNSIKNHNYINDLNNRNILNSTSNMDHNKLSMENFNSIHFKELLLLENFNSNLSKNSNLKNVHFSSSCEKSKLSTKCSLHSKLIYNSKENSDLFNLSKEFNNLKLNENLIERNILLKENIIALRKISEILNNTNNTNPLSKVNFDKNINSDNNQSYENYNISDLDMNNNNYNNLNKEYPKKNPSNLRKKNSIDDKNIFDYSNINQTNSNFNNTQSVIKNFNLNENDYDENKSNTIYESCYSPSSYSIIDQIINDSDFTKDYISLANNENSEKINFESKIDLENKNQLLLTKKNMNEIRTNITKMRFDFYKYKGKNRMIKTKIVFIFYL